MQKSRDFSFIADAFVHCDIRAVRLDSSLKLTAQDIPGLFLFQESIRKRLWHDVSIARNLMTDASCQLLLNQHREAKDSAPPIRSDEILSPSCEQFSPLLCSMP